MSFSRPRESEDYTPQGAPGVPHSRETIYCVSTVGLDEETIRGYIRDQEEIQRRKGETDQQEFDFE
jgi:hypothetical protein